MPTSSANCSTRARRYASLPVTQQPLISGPGRGRARRPDPTGNSAGSAVRRRSGIPVPRLQRGRRIFRIGAASRPAACGAAVLSGHHILHAWVDQRTAPATRTGRRRVRPAVDLCAPRRVHDQRPRLETPDRQRPTSASTPRRPRPPWRSRRPTASSWSRSSTTGSAHGPLSQSGRWPRRVVLPCRGLEWAREGYLRWGRGGSSAVLRWREQGADEADSGTEGQNGVEACEEALVRRLCDRVSGL